MGNEVVRADLCGDLLLSFHPHLNLNIGAFRGTSDVSFVPCRRKTRGKEKDPTRETDDKFKGKSAPTSLCLGIRLYVD